MVHLFSPPTASTRIFSLEGKRKRSERVSHSPASEFTWARCETGSFLSPVHDDNDKALSPRGFHHLLHGSTSAPRTYVSTKATRVNSMAARLHPPPPVSFFSAVNEITRSPTSAGPGKRGAPPPHRGLNKSTTAPRLLFSSFFCCLSDSNKCWSICAANKDGHRGEREREGSLSFGQTRQPKNLRSHPFSRFNAPPELSIYLCLASSSFAVSCHPSMRICPGPKWVSYGMPLC